MPWLHGLLSIPLWKRGFFSALTSRASIRFFLQKTWGAKEIDEGLLEYDYITTHQHGAENAPYYFVSGYLFSTDAMKLYQNLSMPVWMAHGVRGDFVTAGFSPPVRTILEGLKRYGMFVADNGIEWAISVAPDPRIPNMHEELRKLKGSDFEVVTPPPGYVPAK